MHGSLHNPRKDLRVQMSVRRSVGLLALMLVPALGEARGWRQTGSLNTPRYDHTATKLPSGKVLVAGGYGSFPYLPLTSGELYDPDAFDTTTGTMGSWTATGSLKAGRLFHTETLLLTGEVLVVGGAGAADSAELYDPAAPDSTSGTMGSWTTVATELQPRHYGHTATRLNSGKVLITGGWDESTGVDRPVASAAVYDPDSKKITATAPMRHVRYRHTSTLLPSGKVLVTGGWNGEYDFLRFAEVYDPDAVDTATGTTGTWTEAPWMSTERGGHTATLLTSGSNSGKVLVAGGCGNYGFCPSETELYGEDNGGSWSSAGTMLQEGTLLPETRAYHTATLLDSGKSVLLVGGCGVDGVSSGYLASAKQYDDNKQPPWSSLNPLSQERINHTATRLDTGAVLVVGGHVSVPFEGDRPTGAAELY